MNTKKSKQQLLSSAANRFNSRSFVIAALVTSRNEITAQLKKLYKQQRNDRAKIKEYSK